jgi:hypothetical protein
MAKRGRKAKAARSAEGDVLIMPTPERCAAGRVERLKEPIADDAGAIARPWRTVDTLALMQRGGTITAEMRQAGEDFRAAFRTAHLDPLHAASLMRSFAGARDEGPRPRIEAARKEVWRRIVSVGGLASPGGSCLWHVVGLETPLKQWAAEQGWCGRRVAPEAASGILVAVLGILAG